MRVSLDHAHIFASDPAATVEFFQAMFGAAVVANLVYDISYSLYYEKTLFYLQMRDVNTGLAKAGLFSGLISVICCYFGLITEGGSVGLGRNIMVAMVTTLVAIIVADAVSTAFVNNYVF